MSILFKVETSEDGPASCVLELQDIGDIVQIEETAFRIEVLEDITGDRVIVLYDGETELKRIVVS